VPTPDPGLGHPVSITPAEATQLAYREQIDQAATLLRAGLSVLVSAEKAVIEHLLRYIPLQAAKSPRILAVAADPDSTTPTPGDPFAGMRAPRTLRQRYLAGLRTMFQELKFDEVLVIPHLDLLAGGHDTALSAEGREVVELLFGPGGHDQTDRQQSMYDR